MASDATKEADNSGVLTSLQTPIRHVWRKHHSVPADLRSHTDGGADASFLHPLFPVTGYYNRRDEPNDGSEPAARLSATGCSDQVLPISTSQLDRKTLCIYPNEIGRKFFRTRCPLKLNNPAQAKPTASATAITANGMVRPCSCPASDRLTRGPQTRSTPCLQQQLRLQSP